MYATKFKVLPLVVLFLWFGSSCRERTPILSPAEEGIRLVRISAHRGGPAPGFPENALETLQHTADRIPGVMLEVDVHTTRDGQLVLLHDRSLDRTTTLKGRVEEYTLDELAGARLKDQTGAPTPYAIPVLEDVFAWVRDQDAYLSLDVKDTASFGPVADLVRLYGIQEKVELITYTIGAARQVHDYAPELHLSMSISGLKALEETLAAGIDPGRIAAFTGVGLRDRSFYQRLHDEGFVVTLGTLGNLDRRAASRGDALYRDWAGLGIDRFATDRPIEVFHALGERGGHD